MLFRRLIRRIQRRSFNWKGRAAVMSHYGMDQPHITWCQIALFRKNGQIH